MWKSSVDLQPLLDAAVRDVWFHAQVEELDERMKKLTHKLENARRDMVRDAARGVRCRRNLHRPQDFDKAQRVLDKIDAYQHEKELEVQEKLKASERKLEKAKKAGNAADEEKYSWANDNMLGGM